MLGNQLKALVAVFAVVGLAACGGDDTATTDGMVTDTLIEQEQTTVEVPTVVPDTSVVVTDVDTTRDTVDIGPR